MLYDFKYIKVDNIGDFVFHVSLNRPRQLNALNEIIWREIEDTFKKLDVDEDCRVVILSGEGKAFSSGLDLKEGISDIITLEEGNDIARKARQIRRQILKMQQAFTLIEQCCKPVIAAIHGVCFGAGVDLITACDIRHCTADATFSVKEVDIGLAADVGSLNRLPKICGNEGWLREVALTARNFNAEEALKFDLVSHLYPTQKEMLNGVISLAKSIALKSPVAIQGTKMVMNYSRNHSIRDSLEFTATWNQSQLLTEDIPKCAMAVITKGSVPSFSKL